MVDKVPGDVEIPVHFQDLPGDGKDNAGPAGRVDGHFIQGLIHGMKDLIAAGREMRKRIEMAQVKKGPNGCPGAGPIFFKIFFTCDRISR